MRQKIKIVLVLICLVGLSGCACEHQWQDATCTEPKTCAKCGEIEGNALGHKWQDATCTAPKTCIKCGEIEGNALGHKWQDATCTTPKTCTKCGETEGEAIGHTAGEWEKMNPDIVGGEMIQKCIVCGDVISTKLADRSAKEKVTVLTPSGLILSAEEFANHLINYLPEDCYITDVASGGFNITGSAEIGVYYSDQDHSYKDSIGFVSEDPSDILSILPNLIAAVDPDAYSSGDLEHNLELVEKSFDNNEDKVILLNTGIGYTHYTEPLNIGKTTLSAKYWFYFFTLQYALS